MDFASQFQGVLTRVLLSLMSCTFPSHSLSLPLSPSFHLSLSFRLSPSFLPCPSCNTTFVGQRTQKESSLPAVLQEFAYVQITSRWFEISHCQICLRQPYLFPPSTLQARHVRVRFECPGTLRPLPSQDLRVAAFHTFQSLNKENKKKAKMATHSRFCTCLVSHKVTQTLGYLMQMR